jgi:polyferredoxin
MLNITPYLGIIVLIVSIGGIFYPKLGYILLLVFASLMIIAPFRGRWFCGNLCPRGSFVDFWLAPLSRKLKIPPLFRSMWLRAPIFVALMGFMIYCHPLWRNHSPSDLVLLLPHGNAAKSNGWQEVPAKSGRGEMYRLR